MRGHTIGLHPQTKKLEIRTKKLYHVKVLLKSFHLNGNTIGFSSTDSKEKSQTNREQSCFAGRGLTIVGSILEGDFNERAEDVALAKEVKDNCKFSLGAALVANNNRSDKFESISMIPLRSARAVVFEVLLSLSF